MCKNEKVKAARGALATISVPDSPWESIAMDFITDLPESLDPIIGIGYEGILVIVDRFSKAAKFVPVKNRQTAEDLAHLVIRELIATEGVPKSIVSDRDKLFISKFWTALMTRLGTQKKMSTAFHPQTDGQTEWLNQTLEQYLRAYINEEQDNWVELLPTAQLVYNNTPTETTRLSPKEMESGRNGRLALDEEKTGNPAADKMMDKINIKTKQLKGELLWVKEKIKAKDNKPEKIF